jgi:hypothetical protein
VAGARNVGLHPFVAGSLPIGLERAGADFCNLSGRVELSLAIGARPHAKFIIEALSPEISVLVRDPFL